MKRLGNIIMVDDNQNDVSLVSYAFQEAGLNNPVKWLPNGDSLIRHLKSDQAHRRMPLLVVIDWKMPGTNTREVLKWIRQQTEYLGLLVVVLTGSENPDEKLQAYEAGANWHIVKTAEFTDLAKLVHRIQEFWSHVVNAEQHDQLSTH